MGGETGSGTGGVDASEGVEGGVVDSLIAFSTPCSARRSATGHGWDAAVDTPDAVHFRLEGVPMLGAVWT